MARIVLDAVTKQFPGGTTAVRSLDLEVSDGELLVLVGPSGCGKTTALRMVAGLEEVSSGAIYIDGRPVNDVEPRHRDIAMVFQGYALYPHLSVYDNMAFSLKYRNGLGKRALSKPEICDLRYKSLLVRKTSTYTNPRHAPSNCRCPPVDCHHGQPL